MSSTSTLTPPPTSLNTDYPLTPAQSAAYQRDGHIVLRNAIPRADIEAYRPAILETAQRETGDTRPLHERDTLGKAFQQLFHFVRKDERVARFVLAHRFAKIAADLMGADVVRLYHDQVLFKEPGGGQTPWHQDQYYIPLDTSQVITMWIPLIDVSAAMGTMSHASGSHAEGPLFDVGVSDEGDLRYSQLLEERDFPIVPAGDLAVGDINAHTGWTVHRANANHTDTMREVMTILYFADGARILKDAPLAEMIGNMHLGGRGPGDLVDSEVNPIVFRR